MYTIFAIALIIIAAFTGTALAADMAADPSAGDVLKQIFDAVAHGQWWLAASAVVIGAVALARKYMPEAWKAGTKGDIIGVSTMLVLAFATSIGASMAAPGSVMTSAVAYLAVKVALGAAGGWHLLSQAIGWLSGWSKLPAWAKPILTLVASIIGSSAGPSAETVAKAEAAGDAAVAAAPAPGMNAGGKPREVE